MVKVKGTKIIDDGRIIVSVVSTSHPNLKFRGGWSIGTVSCKNHDIADRLVNAIDSGIALRNVRIAVDVNEQEYITGDFQFRMRYINSEMAKAGF